MTVRSVLSGMIESVETELLGRRGVSFSIAKKNTGWTRESRGLSCWRCAESVGPHETDGDGCASCRSRKLAWDRSLRLGLHEGILRDAVLDLKFRRWTLTGMQLGMELGEALNERIQEMGIGPQEAGIVPIPMTHRKRIKRGVDHTLVLARGVSKATEIPVLRLLKARNRSEQVGLSATARAKNMRGAFYLNNSTPRVLKSSKKSVLRALIVLDDVRTTGSTLSEGCVCLKRVFGQIEGFSAPEVWSMSVTLAGSTRKVSVESGGSGELLSKGGEIEQEDDA